MKTQQEIKKLMRKSKEIAELEGYIKQKIRELDYEIKDISSIKSQKEAKLSSTLNI